MYIHEKFSVKMNYEKFLCLSRVNTVSDMEEVPKTLFVKVARELSQIKLVPNLLSFGPLWDLVTCNGHFLLMTPMIE